MSSGVADGPVGVEVLDGAEVELALVRAVFGDVGEPHLVDPVADLPVDEVVVDRRARLSGPAWFLGEHRPDANLRAQSGDAVLAGDDPAAGNFIGDEAVRTGGWSPWKSRAALIRRVSSQSRSDTGSLRRL